MTRPCIACNKSMYIHHDRWVCTDHAQCGATASLSLDELRDAVDHFDERIARLIRLTIGTMTPTRQERIDALRAQRATIVTALREQLEILLDEAESDFKYVQTVYRKAPRSYREDATADAEMTMRHLQRELEELS